MENRSIRHKALRRLVKDGKRKGLIEVDRLIDMLAYIDAVASFDELGIPPNFGFHALKGDRKGQYAMTVTKNWRLTFTKVSDQAITDLDLEDYH